MTDNGAQPPTGRRSSRPKSAAAEHSATPSTDSSREPSILPRGLVIILGLAATVVVAAGIHQVPSIVAPIFLAVVLTVTVNPIRGWMIRKEGAAR